jgi:hypothetical protein
VGMDYDGLDIEELPIGSQINGIYRGESFEAIPAEDGMPEEVVGRLYLDTEDGPRAIGGGGHLQAQSRALELSEGDRIILVRQAADAIQVVREAE